MSRLRTLASRGLLPRVLSDGLAIAQSRMQQQVTALDAMAQPPHGRGPYGGGPLTRAQFRALLAEDEGMQLDVLAQTQWASPAEVAALRRELLRVLPATLPAEGVGSTPSLPASKASTAAPAMGPES